MEGAGTDRLQVPSLKNCGVIWRARWGTTYVFEQAIHIITIELHKFVWSTKKGRWIDGEKRCFTGIHGEKRRAVRLMANHHRHSAPLFVVISCSAPFFAANSSCKAPFTSSIRVPSAPSFTVTFCKRAFFRMYRRYRPIAFSKRKLCNGENCRVQDLLNFDVVKGPESE